MNKIILATPNHPLYESLMKLELPCYTIHSPYEIGMIEDHQNALLFDFTLFNTDQKSDLFGQLKKRFNIISDFSCSWGEMLQERFPEVIGSMAASFFSPKATFEVSQSEDETTSLLAKLNIKSQMVSTPGHGFIYPRTISMIINEAYFSLEDELATESDIDRAMKFGVNYPEGPLAWSKKIGFAPIVMLLDDLYQITHDERYKVSTLLRKNKDTQ